MTLNLPTPSPFAPPQMVSRLVVILVLLLCAVAVTKLMKMSRDLQTKIIWKHEQLNQQVRKRFPWLW
jgi:predicted Holliday junction resolvase-like endonuclease